MHKNYQSISVRIQGRVCFIQFLRTTINTHMLLEIQTALDQCDEHIGVVVLQGNDEAFCLGADFSAFDQNSNESQDDTSNQQNKPDLLYDLWLQLQRGNFISIAHVQGKVNAGGVGFVAACDLVIANEQAEFSLSELLFGLMPACVTPFLQRRIGAQKAHCMTLTTVSYCANQAHQWGLIDVLDVNSQDALRRNILRLSRLSTKAITRYKAFVYQLAENPNQAKDIAIAANQLVLSDPENIEGIVRYQSEGIFPWES